MDQQDSAAAVAAVTTHHPPLPMLIRDRPLDWFALIEFQLTIRQLSIHGQLMSKPIWQTFSAKLPDPFQTVKDRLCQSFVRSEFDLCNEIINHPPLGSDKPSVLLDKIIMFLPEGETQGHLFRTHFLNRLPASIRQHLLHQKFATLRDMAIFADSLFDMDKSNHVSAATIPVHPRSPSPHRRATRSPSPSPRRRTATPWRRPRKPYVEGGSDFCYYHYTFGPKATNCQTPCKFKSKN